MYSINPNSLWTTQRVLKRPQQIAPLITALLAGNHVPPVKLQFCEADDEIEIIDGHHRVFAHYLLGMPITDFLLKYHAKPRMRINRVEDMQWTLTLTR